MAKKSKARRQPRHRPQRGAPPRPGSAASRPATPTSAAAAPAADTLAPSPEVAPSTAASTVDAPAPAAAAAEAAAPEPVSLRRVARLDPQARRRGRAASAAAAALETLPAEDPAIPFARVPYVPADLRRVGVMAALMIGLIVVADVVVTHVVH